MNILFTFQNKTSTVLRFTRKGTQGDEWKHGQIYVKRDVGSPISIRFEGIRGSSYMGDIALDDISINIQNDCPAESTLRFVFRRVFGYLKDTLKAFDDFRIKQQKCMK